jgi:hypothetical protein
MDRNNLYNRYFKLHEAVNLKAVIKDLNTVLSSNNKNIQVPKTFLKNITAALTDQKIAQSLQKAGVNVQSVQKEVQNIVKNFGGNTNTGDKGEKEQVQGQSQQAQQAQQAQQTQQAQGEVQAQQQGQAQGQEQGQVQGQGQTPEQQQKAPQGTENNNANGTKKADDAQVNTLAPSLEKIINGMINKGGAKPTKTTLLAVVDRVMRDLQLTESEAWKAVSGHITREHLF